MKKTLMDFLFAEIRTRACKNAPYGCQRRVRGKRLGPHDDFCEWCRTRGLYHQVQYENWVADLCAECDRKLYEERLVPAEELKALRALDLAVRGYLADGDWDIDPVHAAITAVDKARS